MSRSLARLVDPRSPLWPLPADYETLTVDGQRQARVNACRQWLVPSLSRLDRSAAFVASVRFFDLWYLHPDHDDDFDPLFYDSDPLPSPAMHDEILRRWAVNRMCIGIAPRGSAKSFLNRKSVMLEMLSRPANSFIYATSSGDNTKMFGQSLKDQFQNNQRINDDWNPEIAEGRIIPKRGEAPQGATHMQLMNGSWLRCISAESKQRGGRPRTYILDDPEYDPKASTSMDLIRQYMDTLLFKVVLNMVMRAGCRARWLATFVSKRHYAWHATSIDEKGRAVDPRFEKWDRIIVRSEWRDEDDQPHSSWPEMWPLTKADRLSGIPDMPWLAEAVSLEEIKETIGVPNYNSEYMAQPGDGDEVYFPSLHPDQHGWWVTNEDEAFVLQPRRSNAVIHWKTQNEENDWVLKSMHVQEFLKQIRLFMTVDTSYTANADSDSKVATLMGVDSNNDLFVLDLWSHRAHQNKLVLAAFAMADRWLCPSVHVEAIKEGIAVYNDLVAVVASKGRELADVSYLPRIHKFNPGNIEKTAKIAQLHRRFELGKIKLPLYRRSRTGARSWVSLFNQISEFNPDALNGGLQHDDELDTVSMSASIIRGRLSPAVQDVPEEYDPLDKIAAGEIRSKEGGLHALSIDWSTVSIADVMTAVDAFALGNANGRPSRV